MATYVLFGKYSTDSLKGASAKRTEDCAAFIKSLGGEIQGGYSLLGDTDLMLIVDLPDTERAVRASAGLTKITGIGFKTSPAVTIKEFDKLIGQNP